MPDNIGSICSSESNKNTTECELYKQVLEKSATVIGNKSVVGLVISAFTFLYGGVSDVVGRKTMLQFYMFFRY